MAEQVVGHHASRGEQRQADHHPAEPLGGDVDHHQERRVEQQRGAEVLLEDHHADRDDPRGQQRGEVTRPRHVHAQEVLAGAGEHVALGHQHRREEDQQQDLGELGGLNTEAGEANPDLGAVGLGELGRQQRRNRQQHKADQSADVAVAGQDAVVLEEDHHQREADDPDQGPQHLLVVAGAAAASVSAPLDQVEPVDHHQAKTVEQRHDRQQQRVGVGREAPDGQVRAAEQRQEGQRVAGQIPADALLLVGLHDQQRDDGDQRWRSTAAPVRCCAGSAVGGVTVTGAWGWVRHAAARQSVPGFCGGAGSWVTVGAEVGGEVGDR